MYTRQNSLDFIEQWYADIETGFLSCGKTYVRPADYIERALRVMNGSKRRSRMLNQFEGNRGHYNEDN